MPDSGGRLLSHEAIIRTAIEQLALEGQELVPDLSGPAIYVLGPTSYTVAACRACGAIGLLIGLPARARLFWKHETCGRTYLLEPPLRVLWHRV